MSSADDAGEYRRLKAVFLRVRELDGDALREALETHCAGDPELRRAVEALLQGEKDAPGFLDPSDPTLAVACRNAWRQITGHPPGDAPERIGRYRILGLIAEGGMGAVYRARQDEPEREVAIKLIRPGPGAAALLPRFEREARSLARLQHPGIAQIFEAGWFDSEFGRLPYLAMEFVDGVPIDEGARERGLSVAGRVRLLVGVCEAVEHAHQRGVLHRDLKPANVLLTREGRTKILDFGVARLLDADGGPQTAHTAHGQLIGTIQYMSPEQAAGTSDEVDTRSDVYALGAVAYELLAGRPPHDLTGLSVGAAIRAVQEHEPRRLDRLDPRLDADIAAVVAKAMAKDIDSRYASASELAADLRRVLDSQPVLARPPSVWYTLRKFTQRNKGLVAGGAAAALAIAVGSTFALWQAVERSREADRLREVNAFWNDLFEAPDAASAIADDLGRSDVRVADFLDEASARLAGTYAHQPGVEAELRATIGRTYLTIDRPDAALRELTRAEELLNQVFGPRSTRALATRRFIARAHARLGEFDEADAILLATIAALERSAGPNHPETIACVNDRTELCIARSDVDQQFASACDGLGRVRAAGAERTAEGIDALSLRARIAMTRSHHDLAEQLLLEAIDAGEGLYKTWEPVMLRLMHSLAELEWRTRRFASARAELERIYDIRAERYGPDNRETLDVLGDIAQVVFDSGQQDEGVSLMREAVAEMRRAIGDDDNEVVLAAQGNLGRLLYLAGSYDECERVTSDCVSRCERVHGPDSLATIVNLNHLALATRKAGRMDDAGPLFDSLRERLDRVFTGGPDDRAAVLRKNVGEYYLLAGRDADAEAVLQAAYEDATDASAAWLIGSIAGLLGDLYERQGRDDLAVRWRQIATDAAAPAG